MNGCICNKEQNDNKSLNEYVIMNSIVRGLKSTNLILRLVIQRCVIIYKMSYPIKLLLMVIAVDITTFLLELFKKTDFLL